METNPETAKPEESKKPPTHAPEPSKGVTQMTNPPKKKLKMVHAIALRDLSFKCIVTNKVMKIQAGLGDKSVFPVSQRQLRELSKPATGMYAFGGERIGTDAQEKHIIQKCKLWVAPVEAAPAKASAEHDEDYE